MGRLVLDVSSLARWTGPAVGIARVEHALARAALRRSDSVLAFYHDGRFRTLRPRWQGIVTGWSGMIEGPSPAVRRSRWRPSRRAIVTRLERWRLTLRSPALAGLADGLQRAILALRRHRTPLRDATGERIARVPPDLALGEDLMLASDDVLFCAGSGWSHLDTDALAEMKRRSGFRYATLCYDLIPVTHPGFWLAEVAGVVRAHWLVSLKLADLVIVNARCIAADVQRFAADNAIAPPVTRVMKLGFDPPRAIIGAALPAGLVAGRYALFVSTIEPRKGHLIVLRAWQALLARGIPQRHGFRLVFVGRAGWMVEDVMHALARAAAQGSVLHLAGIGEATLDALYSGAAFALYPSVYEGFGLPIVEAFAHGKAVLASTGGAVPETVDGLSPCLPPEDPAAWEAALADWIENPAARAPWEERIRCAFSHPGWDEAAGAMLDVVASLVSRSHGAEPHQP